MAFSFIQTAQVNDESGLVTSADITISSTSANQLIVVTAYITSGDTLVSITDNQSSSYTISAGQADGGGYEIYQAYAVVGAGVTTITITINAAGNPLGGIVNVFSGVDTVTPFDDESTNNGTGASASVPSFSTNTTLVVASILGSIATSITPGSGYTKTNEILIFGSYPMIASMYKLSSSGGETAPATITYGFFNYWAEIAQSFNPGASSNIKTWNGLTDASVKTGNGLTRASVKTKNGLA